MNTKNILTDSQSKHIFKANGLDDDLHCTYRTFPMPSSTSALVFITPTRTPTSALHKFTYYHQHKHNIYNIFHACIFVLISQYIVCKSYFFVVFRKGDDDNHRSSNNSRARERPDYFIGFYGRTLTFIGLWFKIHRRSCGTILPGLFVFVFFNFFLLFHVFCVCVGGR